MTNPTFSPPVAGPFHYFVAGRRHDDALVWLRTQGNVSKVLADTAAIGRQLDRGNAHLGTLGTDFAKIGLRVTDEIKQRPLGPRRLHRLDRAVKLRNGIVHDDDSQLEEAAAGAAADQALPALDSVHRSAINALAGDLDTFVGAHLGSLLAGTPPW